MSVQRQISAEDHAVVQEQASVDVMTPEEAREAFDRAAQRHLNMSGDEFLRRWDAGAFGHDADLPGVINMVMLLPLVRSDARRGRS